MSRLHIIILIVFISFGGVAQTELAKYLAFAEEQHNKGDYVYAIEYYEKAMQLDSNSVSTLWSYAESLKAYKDYRKAEYYYGEVYKREDTKIYRASLLNYGLMQKQNGKYDAALATFKKAKKKYRKFRREYVYLKAKQEINACIWAKNNLIENNTVIISQLPENVNTKNAEFGHRIIDGQLIYSSLRADSISAEEEVYSPNYKTHLYSSAIKDSVYENGKQLKDLFEKEFSAGNGSLSRDGSRFYFSICKDNNYNYQCKIMVAEYYNGKWKNIDTLGEVINQPGKNTTMPFITEWDGDEVLFFSSNREDTKGGMDIWYSFIKNGNQYKEPKNVRSINTIDNELSPFWEPETKKLFYSSSWEDGYGGYDIFESQYTTRFETPKNLGLPFNSAANDLYFFRNKTQDTSYVTSNRLGVLYAKNPTCCSDIFQIIVPPVQEPPSPKESLAEINKRLPVTLYFHNDIPNPRSWDTTSNVNYIESYEEYLKMIPKYEKEYAKGLSKDKAADAKDDIDDFFVEYVEQGVKDLVLFRDLLLAELDKGTKIQLTVKGFASPLAKTDYNVNLTKRRIASLKNYLYRWDNGQFRKYLDQNAENGAYLTIVQIPFGEYTANQLTSDNPNDVQNSVYSRAAGIERKIEVQSVNIIEENNEPKSTLSAQKQVEDLGKIKKGETVTKQFTVTNTSNQPLKIENIRIPCDCNTAEASKENLNPGESATVKMTFDTTLYDGKVVKSVYLKYSGSDKELRLIMTGEIE